MSNAATATTENPVVPSVVKEGPHATIVKIYEPKSPSITEVKPETKKIEEDKDEEKKE